jgi:outer membrane receptor for ferric coprogen and ferric-rhodotorulic acid
VTVFNSAFAASGEDSAGNLSWRIGPRYEIGLKSEFLDRRVRTNLALYLTNLKDFPRKPGGGRADHAQPTP